MKICDNCGNKIRNKAIYCDICGNFLGINNKIDVIFKENPKKEELKKILLYSSTLIDENGTFSGSSDMKFNISIISDYLQSLTNINQVLKNNNLTFDSISREYVSILINMKNVPEEYFLDYFLFELNSVIEKNNSKLIKKFIFYTNIDSKFIEDNNFKIILDFFKLKIFNFDNFQFKIADEQAKKNFDSNYVILESKINGKNFHMMKNEAITNIYSLYGFITFIHKFNLKSEKFFANVFKSNFQVSDLDISTSVILNEDDSFHIHDKYFLNNIIYSKKIEKSKLMSFKNMPILPESIKLLADIKHKKVLSEFRNIFKFYYLANNKEDLSDSFIKFCSLNERVFKKIFGKQKDEILINKIEKLLKFYSKNNFFKYKLNLIRRKRNKLVHENISEITQEDRNFVKHISDVLIYFLMDFTDKINSFSDYGLILDNYAENNINHKIDLIKYASELKHNLSS